MTLVLTKPFQLSPDITSESSQYVHHIVVYLCETLDHSHVGESSECENANLIIQQCRGGGTVIAAWAVGGIVSSFVFAMCIREYWMHFIFHTTRTSTTLRM